MNEANMWNIVLFMGIITAFAAVMAVLKVVGERRERRHPPKA